MSDWCPKRQPRLVVVAVDLEYSMAQVLGMCPEVVARLAFVCWGTLCFVAANSVAMLDIEVVLAAVVSDVDDVAWLQRERLSHACGDVYATVGVEGDVGASSIF